jgi:uncharacterized damage-inducible protein DinB
MRQHIIDTFNFNSGANMKVLEKVKQLPDKTEAIRFLSHLINCQYKWMARTTQNPKVQEMSWWEPLYTVEEIPEKWNDSVKLWIDYISSKTDEELSKEVTYIGNDGDRYISTPKDIALQLNYHSIHHRAQIQTIIRQQGLAPDFVDYISTKFRKADKAVY